MAKFFVKEEQIQQDQVKIQGEDVNHIVNVLRLKKKDDIIINNTDTGVSYYTEIVEINKENVICKIKEEIEETTESNIHVTIFQGLPKADKMEYIIQKTTELGVKEIIPISMKRCIVKLDEKDKVKKIQRWQKIAEVASKQSQRDHIPNIQEPKIIQDVCDQINKFDIFLVAYENEENISLKNELKKQKEQRNINKKDIIKIGILIGPEGGIDIDEIEKLKESGAKIVSLGKRILRTETAPLAMLSNILYELESE